MPNLIKKSWTVSTQGCGDPTLPNVFARITEVLGWIFSVMKPSAKTCLPTETDLKARLYYL